MRQSGSARPGVGPSTGTTSTPRGTCCSSCGRPRSRRAASGAACCPDLVDARRRGRPARGSSTRLDGARGGSDEDRPRGRDRAPGSARRPTGGCRSEHARRSTRAQAVLEAAGDEIGVVSVRACARVGDVAGMPLSGARTAHYRRARATSSHGEQALRNDVGFGALISAERRLGRESWLLDELDGGPSARARCGRRRSCRRARSSTHARSSSPRYSRAGGGDPLDAGATARPDGGTSARVVPLLEWDIEALERGHREVADGAGRLGRSDAANDLGRPGRLSLCELGDAAACARGASKRGALARRSAGRRRRRRSPSRSAEAFHQCARTGGAACSDRARTSR